MQAGAMRSVVKQGEGGVAGAAASVQLRLRRWRPPPTVPPRSWQPRPPTSSTPPPLPCQVELCGSLRKAFGRWGLLLLGLGIVIGSGWAQLSALTASEYAG